VKLFRGLAVASALLAFVIAVLGSWVRINGAGLTCPDWPLCHGALVPSLEGGVILEWSHRLIAFVESFVILGAIVTGLRERSRIAGVTPTLAALGVVFACQVTLGGATVLLANSPVSVMLHWAMGMALLAILTALAVLATLAPKPARMRTLRATIGEGAAPALATAAAFAFLTMCVGAYVSSSYAGLACATVPACDGTLFGHGSAQLAQMLHRLGAFSFAIVAAIATFVAARNASRRVFACALSGMGLIAVQIGLGLANVVWQLPIGLREAHAANAGATFIVFVVAAVLAALDPQPTGARSIERAPAAGRVVGA
jgi:heme A synthase